MDIFQNGPDSAMARDGKEREVKLPICHSYLVPLVQCKVVDQTANDPESQCGVDGRVETRNKDIIVIVFPRVLHRPRHARRTASHRNWRTCVSTSSLCSRQHALRRKLGADPPRKAWTWLRIAILR